MTDTRSPGVDVSRYDCPIDWVKFGLWPRANTFVGLRATISWGYRDPFYVANNTGIKALKLPRLPYHVLYPGEDVARQVTNYLGCVNGEWDFAHPVIDLELAHAQTVDKITDATLQFQELVQTATGKRPIVYSRANWIDTYTRNDGWRANEQWWLANYLFNAPEEHPGPPALPKGVATYLIHQTSQKLPVPAGIMYRTYTDADRWNGGADAVSAFFRLELPVEEWAQFLDAWARVNGYTGPYPEAA